MKSMLAGGAVGLLAGVAVNQAACLLLSLTLRLGYYAPCLAGLGEVCGGELNAAAAQTLVAALLGMGMGAGIGRRRRRAAVQRRRRENAPA
ncbi:MAG: hypothetical protein ACI4OY_13280 [Aristaeellaceae bacterium]